MPLIDSDSKLLFFLCVILITTLVTLSKFVFFTFDYFYTIRKMIFLVIKELTSDSVKSKLADPQNTTNDAYDAEVEKDFDTHIVNLLRYLENNQDSNQRLDTVDAESSRYIRYHNYVMVVRFFTVIFLLTLLACMASHYKYGSFMTQFWAALKTQ